MDEKNKRPQIRVRQEEYDGVVYTPGTAAKYQEENRRAPSAQSSRQTPGVVRRPAVQTRKVAAKRRKRKQKSQVGVFLAASLFIGVVACIIVFAMVFAPLLTKAPDTTEEAQSNLPTQVTEQPAEIMPASLEETEELSGVVKSVGDGGTLFIYDFNTGKNLNFLVDNRSKLQDKYSNAIVFAEIEPGEIVDITYSGNTIRELIFSRQARAYPNSSNVTIDTELRQITIGNDVFSYNENIVTYAGGGELDLLSIKPIDEVEVKFFNNTVWYLGLNKGHGFMAFSGAESIVGGKVEIDNNIIRDLNDFDDFEILEGVHWVVVKGENVKPISKEVVVERGKTAEMDLSEMELLKGQLVLTVNEADYTAIIDGESADLTQPIMLGYGSHTIMVEKEGFFPYEGTFEITKEINPLTVELSEKILYSKLVVNSLPEGAEIYVDSLFVGVTPCSANIEYGTHTLTYKKEGYKVVDYELILDEPNEPFTVILQEEIPFMPDTIQ
ncbi:MAG: PEGA domain-containing protein [Clostridiales bacterium]|jgi:hypothetical protein|nr:PEGA domain-containing protein [Clostridiales bacterium]